CASTELLSRARLSRDPRKRVEQGILIEPTPLVVAIDPPFSLREYSICATDRLQSCYKVPMRTLRSCCECVAKPKKGTTNGYALSVAPGFTDREILLLFGLASLQEV